MGSLSRQDTQPKCASSTPHIEKAEREIDAIVYRLFDLTPDEITLLEASIARQF